MIQRIIILTDETNVENLRNKLIDEDLYILDNEQYDKLTDEEIEEEYQKVMESLENV